MVLSGVYNGEHEEFGDFNVYYKENSLSSVVVVEYTNPPSLNRSSSTSGFSVNSITDKAEFPVENGVVQMTKEAYDEKDAAPRYVYAVEEAGIQYS